MILNQINIKIVYLKKPAVDFCIYYLIKKSYCYFNLLN